MLKQSGYRRWHLAQLPSWPGTHLRLVFQQSSFASLTIAMARNTIRVPDEAPLDILAAFPCGVNTGAGAVMNVLKPPPGASYVAFGTGTVGFAGLLAARLAGCDPIIAVDLFDDRLALALQSGSNAHGQCQGPTPGRRRQTTGGRAWSPVLPRSGGIPRRPARCG